MKLNRYYNTNRKINAFNGKLAYSEQKKPFKKMKRKRFGKTIRK